jgi:ketosteroid isomerase-like protein
MSDSANITLVRRLYDSGMAPEVAAEVIAEDLVFDITPGFPFGGVYHGWDSTGSDFFGRLLPNFESFAAGAEQFYSDDQDHVFVYGHYHATPKDGGEPRQARFIHLWTVRDRKLAHLVQAADSHVVHQAAGI